MKPTKPRPPADAEIGPKFHPLFTPNENSPEDFHPEPIKNIYVTRFESRGPIQALRPFRPEELQDNASIYQRFGGGTYELVARRDDGSIYAKRIIPLEGESKSMNGDPATNGAQAPTAPAAPAPAQIVQPPQGSSDLATMMGYMFQMQMAQMQSTTQIVVAALTGKKDDTMSALPQIIGGAMQAVTAAMPKQESMTVKDVIEMAKALQPPAPPPPPPPPPPKEETVGDIVGAIGGALGTFMQMAGANAAAAATQQITQGAQAASALTGMPG